ncbi:MAG: ATP-binding protein [Deltaproteobacteria bacterium]|nr:ATP-binding protein [Deltaproteobacteria bacterium]
MNTKWRITILASFILLITLLHNISSIEGPIFLNIYQRLYYIPIVLAAFWFGLKGALITSLISTFLYPHHGHYHWPDRPFYTLNQYAEMMMFNLIGIVTGILSDLEKRQRRKYEQAAIELKTAYQQLQDSFEQVRMADRLSALGQLSAGMAHEIRNPLGSIKGGIEIIEDGIDEHSKKYEFIQIIKKEINRLDRKISDFLKYAKPASPERRGSNINGLVSSVISLVEKRAEQEDILISTKLADKLPDILIDSEQIRQALLNIVLNAIQSIKEEGEIEVATGRENDLLYISVSDNGSGIAEENVARLFDPFFTTKDEGTGLGLSITFQIVRAHGGEIEVKQKESGGSAFIIKLPFKEVSNAI